MRSRCALIAAVLLLVACAPPDQNPAGAYRSGLDQWIVQLGLPSVGIFPCRDNHAVENCFKTEPPQHWRGTWTLGPGEHDERFCITNLSACRAQQRTRYVLTPARDGINIWSVAHGDRATAYNLDFVGRRTTYPVDWSAFADPVYVIVVDRPNFMKPIEFDPEPTETQIENEMKRSDDSRK